MASCGVCGADLQPGRARCGKCGAPVGEETGAPPVFIVGGPRDPGDPEDRGPGGGRSTPPPVTPVFSSWRAGPGSFGPVGRLAFTALILAIGYFLYRVALGVGEFYGVLGLSLVMLMIGVFTVLAVLVLWGVWRPTRVE